MVNSVKKSKAAANAGAGDLQAPGRMAAPASGVRVRMYRPGHGDCFLLAFRGDDGEPRYVLIDCGFKPGSVDNHPAPKLRPISEIVANIAAATGNRLDLAIVTHEHQDHVNGLGPAFEGFEICEAWFAWTEDPDDTLANDLRRRHRDRLVGLIRINNALAARPGAASEQLATLLETETGEQKASLFAAALSNPEKSLNKVALRRIKDRARLNRGIRYIRPHEGILTLDGVPDVRVFALGPPRDPDLLDDEDPVGSEAFPKNAFGGSSSLFAAADIAAGGVAAGQPFDVRDSIPLADVVTAPFFRDHYGAGPAATAVSGDDRVADDADFRRIDNDWLYAAEDFALKLNRGINNTSLVLAFELGKSGKVLLFPGDAQRGNWMSWDDGDWKDGEQTITTRDLLARTVLYKVGHHASHNATLKGAAADTYPNLGWMAQGPAAAVFMALIPAVEVWAYAQKPVWAHPQKAIRAELVRRTAGRILQTDTDWPAKPDAVDQASWNAFTAGLTVEPDYFEFTIPDSW